MNVLTVIGLALGAATIVVDHHVRPIPNKAAVILYSLAVVCVLAGMILARQAG